MNTRISSLCQQEWSKTALSQSSSPSWVPRISPPIPSAWPVTTDTTVSWYLYAAGRDPQLADGERVIEPWGRIDAPLRSLSNLQFISLTAKPASLGVQGVRPLTREQADLLSAGVDDRTVADLQSLADPLRTSAALAAVVLKRYRLEFQLNGVASTAYLRHHPAFVAALSR